MNVRQKSARQRIALGDVTIEELPYPVVHYPNHYGTFFAFSNEGASDLVMCECSKPLLENYVRLRKGTTTPLNAKPERMAILSSLDFPDAIVAATMKNQQNPLSYIEFRERVCHRCNMTKPSLKYCHEMYGGQFVQQYGWFINQTYLRLGILRWGTSEEFSYLHDLCPHELQADIEEMREELRMSSHVSRGNGSVHIYNRINPRLKRRFENKVQNITRQEFGFKRIGDGWISETILFEIVRSQFPGSEIMRHFRPAWLSGLELDIYIPSLRLAFEYQGQQHFFSIKAWGGEDALRRLKERDREKARLCQKHSVSLVTVNYYDPLSIEFVRRRVAELNPRQSFFASSGPFFFN